MRQPKQNEIRVVIREVGKDGQSLRYLRPFVGLTVSEAIDRLDGVSIEPEGSLPKNILMLEPYYLNDEEVDESRARVLSYGDTLSAKGFVHKK